MNIILLGHKGMLGHIVKKYFEQQGIKVKTTEYKWPSKEFRYFVETSSEEFLINCIGQIPQKNKDIDKLFLNNYALPIYLSNVFNNKIVHPTTDCEFKGVEDESFLYSKNKLPDAEDDYGRSKSLATLSIAKNPKVVIIRTSIIGPELSSKKSLWEWFINSDLEVNGFTNHIWNGLTTLQWAKICYKIFTNEINESFIQVGCAPISKFKILEILNKELGLNKKINPFKTISINKALESDIKDIPEIKDQIKEFILWQKN